MRNGEWTEGAGLALSTAVEALLLAEGGSPSEKATLTAVSRFRGTGRGGVSIRNLTSDERTEIKTLTREFIFQNPSGSSLPAVAVWVYLVSKIRKPDFGAGVHRWWDRIAVLLPDTPEREKRVYVGSVQSNLVPGELNALESIGVVQTS